MATQWGAWRTYNGLNAFRLGIDLSGTTLIVYGQAQIAHSWNATLVRSWTSNVTVSFSSNNGTTTTRELSRSTISSSGTYSASLTVPWGSIGTASVSRSVTVGSRPGPPTITKFQRGGTNTFTFTKGSGSTSTIIQYSLNSASYYTGASTTGTTFSTGLAADSYWRARLYGSNSAGNSDYSNLARVYTTPKAPSKLTVGANRLVSWSNAAKYVHGVQVQRTNDGGATTTTVDVGAVTSWTDPTAQKPLTQYRVRSWAGPSFDEDRTYSAWSAWSDNAMAASYEKPTVSGFRVLRANSNGDLTEMGTYARVSATFTVDSVLDGDDETNWVTRRVGWREKGSTGAYSTTNLVTQSITQFGTRTLAATVGGSLDPTKAYEFRYEVADAYSGSTWAYKDLPVAQVAFSVAEAGVGAGKTWEQGALDVGGDAHVSGDAHIAGNLHLSDPNVIVIDGTAYQASGRGSIPSTPAFTAHASNSVFVRTLNLDPPYVPPEGWGFMVGTGYSSTYSFLDGSGLGLTDGKIRVRHMQIGNSSTTATTSFRWMLMKTSRAARTVRK